MYTLFSESFLIDPQHWASILWAYYLKCPATPGPVVIHPFLNQLLIELEQNVRSRSKDQKEEDQKEEEKSGYRRV